MHRLFSDFIGGRGAVGLLILRVIFGAALMQHGWPKIQNPLHWMPPEAPVPGFLQLLAAVSEFFGGLALIVGLLTPIAAFGIFCTMTVAFLAVHLKAGDPWVSQTGGHSFEPALGYWAVALLMMLAGPGRLSLDALVFGRGRGGQVLAQPDRA